MVTRSRYWSCSKFARWVTRALGGIEKPNTETVTGWANWKKSAKAQAPFVFWFTETALDKIQNFINYPIDKLTTLRYYLFNRFVARTHLCKTELPPGRYNDTGVRIFHGMFTELVNFIEIEKAWIHVAWDKENQTIYGLPWWKRHLPSLCWWGQWRSPAAGLAHLEWEKTLVYDFNYLPEEDRVKQEDYNKPTTQALAAMEQYELYVWWTLIRPNRPDPSVVSGWGALGDMDESSLGFLDKLHEPQSRYREAMEAQMKIEEQYEKEDVDMMVRLVKIYDTLWT